MAPVDLWMWSEATYRGGSCSRALASPFEEGLSHSLSTEDLLGTTELLRKGALPATREQVTVPT